MEWTNNLQKAIVQEWLEDMQRDPSPEGQRRSRKRIKEKLGISSVQVVKEVVELAATQGLCRVKNPGGLYQGRKYDVVNIFEGLVDLRRDVDQVKYDVREIMRQDNAITEKWVEQTILMHQQKVNRRRMLGREINPESLKLDFFDIEGR